MLRYLVRLTNDPNKLVSYKAHEGLARCPTQHLLRHYLDSDSREGLLKNLLPFIRQRLYKEKLVIQPGKKPEEQELMLHLSSGGTMRWTVSGKQEEALRERLNNDIKPAKKDSE